jgi:hypothetical protein
VGLKQTGCAVEQTGGAWEQTGSVLEQTGSVLEQTGSAPEQIGSVPEQTTQNMPGYDHEVVGQQWCIPRAGQESSSWESAIVFLLGS